MNVTQGYLAQLPIKSTSKVYIERITKYVNKVIDLNNRFLETSEADSTEKNRLRREIQTIEDELDDLVYRIYHISKEEKGIIENSLK